MRGGENMVMVCQKARSKSSCPSHMGGDCRRRCSSSATSVALRRISGLTTAALALSTMMNLTFFTGGRRHRLAVLW